MPADILSVILAFLEGFALIISPCILPILPIMLAGSVTGTKSRPLGIISGFIVTFSVVTLFSRGLIGWLHIPPDLLRNISFAILILLALMMMSETLSEKFNIFTNRLLSVGSSSHAAIDINSGFWNGLLFGGLVGIIWTPCAGPILAAVIVQTILQKTSLSSFFTVLAFALGAGVPMLLIALAGRSIVTNLRFFREHTGAIRKLLGGIILLSVVAMIYLPVGFFNTVPGKNNMTQTGLIDGLSTPYQAPAIAGISDWINSAPLTLDKLRGKVVLIDFWTYSCINCIRTLPYIKDWYAKYHAKGFEVIGVHAPEFQFEHDLSNVKNAVIADGILYPVALDNNFVTWQNYQNRYWPAHYLINKDGQVVYQHFGEGDYDVTENNIRYLLGMKGMVTGGRQPELSASQTPETYLGYARSEEFASIESLSDNQEALYTYPDVLNLNQWALQGKWIVYADKIVSVSPNAAIKLHFDATHVYAVMGATKAVNIKLLLDGKVQGRVLRVDTHKLYTLLDLKKETEGYLELIAPDPGLEMYTFTFG